jgi:hypothetical protein
MRKIQKWLPFINPFSNYLAQLTKFYSSHLPSLAYSIDDQNITDREGMKISAGIYALKDFSGVERCFLSPRLSLIDANFAGAKN